MVCGCDGQASGACYTRPVDPSELSGVGSRETESRIRRKYDLTKIFKFLEDDDLPLSKPVIAAVLVKMKQRGDISILKPGKGRNPAVYVPAKILTAKQDAKESIAA